jgi:hypothetical protein
MTHQVKNRFQSLPFKRDVHRYIAVELCVLVGLYNLNPV